MQYGDRDGHGHYGKLEEASGGLRCHECGHTFHHLGLHVWRRHGITTAAYRQTHGLQRRRGLVSTELRTRIQTNATARMDTPAGAAFTAARDPQLAQAARLSQRLKPAAAAIENNRIARTGTGRLGTEVTCQNPDCRAVFCPLHSARRRQFCSRRCASIHARNLKRAAAGDNPGPAATPT
ncbi:MucR family transcriptional regulator [Kribbella sp. NPDC048928]|uniref:MucR family transcriptional regulator n=1 Tax=Kribbella sp. NPDC048928 TaxID=3364111 RepID=UPI003719AC8F